MPQPAQRAVRRIVWLALAASIVLTAAILTAPQEAIAIPCCETCDLRALQCELICLDDLACFEQCIENLQTCYNVCLPCT